MQLKRQAGIPPCADCTEIEMPVPQPTHSRAPSAPLPPGPPPPVATPLVKPASATTTTPASSATPTQTPAAATPGSATPQAGATPGTLPTHFVIHSTGGEMLEKTIQEQYVGKRSKAHLYILTDGKVVENWPMSDRNVWATKMESKKPATKGLMIHVELNYKDTPTDQQYATLADKYIEATKLFGSLIIVPHREVDRGVANGHDDPSNFDFDRLYREIGAKGFDLTGVQKIEQVRYKCANQADHESSWPPVLSGKPRRKPPATTTPKSSAAPTTTPTAKPAPGS